MSWTEVPDSDAQESIALPVSPWRRPALIAAGLGLLSLGVFVNVGRFGRSEPGRASATDLARAGDEEAGGAGQRHRGEEGKMGRPSSEQKSGLYAMKAPSGFAGMPVATGMVGTGRGGGGTGEGTIGLGNTGLIGKGGGGGAGRGYGSATAPAWTARGDTYADAASPNGFVFTADDAMSTFSIDVDTASYANVRRFVTRDHQLPPPAAVRTEELVNYFEYAYAQPEGDVPFSIAAEVGPSPWSEGRRLVHIGLQGKAPSAEQTPPRNLVFLVDVSGSMRSGDKLPLVIEGLSALVGQLRQQDRITVVTYAGDSAEVLPPTSGGDKERIRRALADLRGGGGTNGAAGIVTAYERAQENLVEGGINRVILATDGDFNVGISDRDALVDLIEAKRESGVFLSVLGVGRGNLRDDAMEQLADKGNGNYAYLDSELEARKVLVEQAGSTLDTIAKDVKIQVEFDPAQVAEHRLVGYENRVLAHEDFDDDTKDAGEIGAGHTVTALYEIVVADGATPSHDMMRLSLRYKDPDGDQSRRIDLAVADDGRTLEDTSDAFRFSAAVAAFGERLGGAQMGEGFGFAETMALASGALGDDPHCYRHGFLEVVHAAATLSDEDVAAPAGACVPANDERVAPPGPTPASASAGPVAAAAAEHPADVPFDWAAFALQVLRLLPPLLALPLFVMAFRNPRRRG